MAVRRRRREASLSLEELAERAGLSSNYIGDAERGERNISIRALWQLADGLDVAASSILGDAERPERVEPAPGPGGD